ncbi:hypothetical protein AKJ41_01910 [candidate division MSBL1 archaeon SCGC-AAA259O05]|uniref:Uncharacterized protein n=1 Tax=candidate division MSBL1 archaeon SCGC-AAA259O05 TaxID=1698271 RepID=A0A133V4H3_9EURY|nr:hypothetical protein AKJ41_01910 [candidate division MSBL1 archaeon SCGC-AAA259O05]
MRRKKRRSGPPDTFFHSPGESGGEKGHSSPPLPGFHHFSMLPEIPLFPASFFCLTSSWWTGEERYPSRASISFLLNRLPGSSGEKSEKREPLSREGIGGKGKGDKAP